MVLMLSCNERNSTREMVIVVLNVSCSESDSSSETMSMVLTSS